MATVDIRYLTPDLRLTIGDTAPATYRYADEWLEIALLGAIRELGRWWNYRYLIDETTRLIYRNPNTTFLASEPPVIQMGDERPVIVKAAIIVLKGDLQNVAWNLAAWRDAEISYSNLEGGRAKKDILKELYQELRDLITPPTKRLAHSKKRSLPGYKNNLYEKEAEIA